MAGRLIFPSLLLLMAFLAFKMVEHAHRREIERQDEIKLQNTPSGLGQQRQPSEFDKRLHDLRQEFINKPRR